MKATIIIEAIEDGSDLKVTTKATLEFNEYIEKEACALYLAYDIPKGQYLEGLKNLMEKNISTIVTIYDFIDVISKVKQYNNILQR